MIWREGVCLARITAGFLFHVGCEDQLTVTRPAAGQQERPVPVL